MKIVKVTDGLGNQMFQYAFARSYALQHRERVYLDKRFINNEDRINRKENVQFFKKCGRRQYGLDSFNISLLIAPKPLLQPFFFIKNETLVQKVFYTLLNDVLYIKEDSELFQEVLNEEKKTPCYLDGYFFRLEYYKDIRRQLLRDFTPKNKIKLHSSLKQIYKERNTVSIHVRRGDFLALHRCICNSEYYDNAVAYIKENVDNPIFVIFSDDIAWVREYMLFGNDVIYASELGYKDYEEMMLMKHCKHNIIANSTFSYWGAWLNENKDKLVIAPKGWRKSIIPEEWVTL